MPELLYEEGSRPIGLFVLDERHEGPYWVGRHPRRPSPEAEPYAICLSQAGAEVSGDSGPHGRIEWTLDGWTYADWGSRNGTRLERRSGGTKSVDLLPAKKPVVLHSGTALRLGRSTRLVFGDFLAAGRGGLLEQLLEPSSDTELAADDEIDAKAGARLLEGLAERLARVGVGLLHADHGLVHVAVEHELGKNEVKRGARRSDVVSVADGDRPDGTVDLRTYETESDDPEPISRAWVSSIWKKGSRRFRFNRDVGAPFAEAAEHRGADRLRDRYLCVPIAFAGRRHGVLYLARPSHARSVFTEVDARRAEELGAVAGALLERLLARTARDPLRRLVGNVEVRERFAQLDAPSGAGFREMTALILGETGTGKELVARALHEHSPRAAGPLVAVNAAQVGGENLAAQLFGTDGKKFTNVKDSRGLIEAAHGGTLFIDEIGELSPDGQAKLLRVVDHREVTRVGGTEPRRVDVRFVFATNRDLEAMQRDGSFRPDLYLRASRLILRTRPVRDFPAEERRELFRRVLGRLCREYGVQGSVATSDAALSILMDYPWLGNVREVENELAQALLSASGAVAEGELMIEPHHLSVRLTAYLPSSLGEVSEGTATEAEMDLRKTVDAVTRHMIRRALALTDGNGRRAAELLNVNYKTLHGRAKQLGIRFGRGNG